MEHLKRLDSGGRVHTLFSVLPLLHVGYVRRCPSLSAVLCLGEAGGDLATSNGRGKKRRILALVSVIFMLCEQGRAAAVVAAICCHHRQGCKQKHTDNSELDTNHPCPSLVRL